jgi:hypothetical protein
VPSTENLAVLHVGLELCEPDVVQRWLKCFDPRSHFVAVSAVELSVPHELADLRAAIEADQVRWVDVDLVMRGGALHRYPVPREKVR